MRRKLRYALFAGIVVTAALMALPALAANGDLIQLTIQTRVNMAGMGEVPPQTVKRTECLSAGRFDVEQLLKPASASDCKITNYKADGDTITFDQVCTRPEALTSHGEIHLTGASGFTGHVHTEMMAAGHAMSMDISYTGERVGSCDYSPAKG